MVSEGSSRSDMCFEYLEPVDVNLVCSHTLMESTKLVPTPGPLYILFPLLEMLFPQIFG